MFVSKFVRCFSPPSFPSAHKMSFLNRATTGLIQLQSIGNDGQTYRHFSRKSRKKKTGKQKMDIFMEKSVKEQMKILEKSEVIIEDIVKRAVGSLDPNTPKEVDDIYNLHFVIEFFVKVNARNFEMLRFLAEKAARLNLKEYEQGFYLRTEHDLFPHATRPISRWSIWTRIRALEMRWLSWKHRRADPNGFIPADAIVEGLEVAVVKLSQHLKSNTLNHLVSSGLVSEKAASAVKEQLSTLSNQQRKLFNLFKDDQTLALFYGILSPSVYMMKERWVGSTLFLDYYAQCLMICQKSQFTIGERANGELITTWKEPESGKQRATLRPMFVMARFSRQVKPPVPFDDLKITAFNYVVMP